MQKLTILLLIIACSCQEQQRQRDKKVSDLTPANHIPANSPEYLFQYWEITDAEHPMVKDVGNSKDSIYNSPGLVFLRDSTMVENPRGELRFGKFSFADKKIKASFSDGGTATYVINSIHPTELELTRNEKNNQTILHLKAQGKPFAAGITNPYEPSLNQWRIRPKKPESKEQLVERVKQFVQFYANFFNDNLQSGATEIDFLGLPSCFKWYKGGIYVQSENKLDKKFIQCFYSKEQALEARQILVDALTKKYKWDTNEPDWIKQTAPVLQQVHDSL